jgi:RNA polymerase sigma-70 factor (ECF subfamily)
MAVARTYVGGHAVAEEVVQDTWLAILRQLDRFEERSSLKTWIYRILVDRAKSVAPCEQRQVLVGLASDDADLDVTHFSASGSWAAPPTAWADEIEDRVNAQRLGESIRAALNALPDLQRAVVTLRDIEDLDAMEVCALLEISEGNQRALLHRGRTRLRQALKV